MKKIIALAMVCAILLALAGCGKSAAVKETERLINAIGTVTVDSAAAVETAEAAYKALSQEDKEQIGNYDVLTAAREALDAAQLEAARHDLLGTWKTELDIKDALVSEMDAQFTGVDVSFGDYLESFNVTLSMELKEDGTYRMAPDKSGMESAMQGLRDAMIPFIRGYLQHYIADVLRQSGIEGDFTTLEGLENAMGMDLDSAIVQSMGMSLEDYVDTLMDEMNAENVLAGYEQTGLYRVEPGKLYISRSPDQEPGENQYDHFTLSGDTLTLKSDEAEPVLGITEMVFHRAG